MASRLTAAKRPKFLFSITSEGLVMVAISDARRYTAQEIERRWGHYLAYRTFAFFREASNYRKYSAFRSAFKFALTDHCLKMNTADGSKPPRVVICAIVKMYLKQRLPGLLTRFSIVATNQNEFEQRLLLAYFMMGLKAGFVIRHRYLMTAGRGNDEQ